MECCSFSLATAQGEWIPSAEQTYHWGNMSLKIYTICELFLSLFAVASSFLIILRVFDRLKRVAWGMEPSDRTRMWGFNASNYNVATMCKLIVKVKKKKTRDAKPNLSRNLKNVKLIRLKAWGLNTRRRNTTGLSKPRRSRHRKRAF